MAMHQGDAFDFMQGYPKLEQACDLVIDNLLPKFELDIKRDNIMMRGKTIVLSDPIKSMGQPEQEVLPYAEPIVTKSEPPLEKLSPVKQKELDDLFAELDGWDFS